VANADIAICISTYNQSAFLRQAVESALRQRNIVAEIWISDDASTDATPAVLAALKREYPALNITTQSRNLGMGGNPNWLLRQPKTKWLVKLDSDDVLAPDYCAELIGLLTQHFEAGYAHANVREIDQHGEFRRTRALYRPQTFISGEQSLKASVQGYRVAANIICFRREALESIGFWKADMSFADDWDLSVRMADQGWGNVHCPKVLASYRVWDDVDGYRAGRKLREIIGITRVFEESLAPAFARRHWNSAPLARRRRVLATNQADALYKLPANSAEFQQIESALLNLGDSLRLRSIVALVRHGGAPLISAVVRAKRLPRNSLKRLVVAMRRHANAL
jgi:GT2 family glycosyltransferase